MIVPILGLQHYRLFSVGCSGELITKRQLNGGIIPVFHDSPNQQCNGGK